MINRSFISIFMVLICLSKVSLPQGLNKYITGYVLDHTTNTPIQGVDVVLIEKIARIIRTDSRGVFAFEIDDFDSRRPYKISFFATGYKPIIDTFIYVLPDGSLPNAIKLTPTYQPAYHAYYGFVMDKRVNFLPNVNIPYFCERRWSKTKTNESGFFYFEVSDNCKEFIEVIFEKSGYKTLSDTLKGTDKLHIVNMQPQYVSFVNYTEFLEARRQKAFQLGVGFGLQSSDSLFFSYISDTIRSVMPHINDVKDRYWELLDTLVRDNYLIYENNAFIKLPGRKNIDLINLSYFGLINLTLKTSTIGSSKEEFGYNFYRKNYIKPQYYGFAYIYYSINTAERGIMHGRSLSVPIYFTFPVFYLGGNHEVHNRVIFGITGGSNAFWPSRVEVVAENGWDRFGSLDLNETFYLGEIKEIEWFWGAYIEGVLFHPKNKDRNPVRINCQLTITHPDYRGNFTNGLRFEYSKKPLTSFRIGITMPLDI